MKHPAPVTEHRTRKPETAPAPSCGDAPPLQSAGGAGPGVHIVADSPGSGQQPLAAPAHAPDPPHARLHTHAPAPALAAARTAQPGSAISLLAWPAWQRMVAVLPVLLLLWLAVAWAAGGTAPW